MKKNYLKVMAVSLLLSGASVLNTACSCGGSEVKITFITEGNSDIVKYVKKGKTLVDIPQTPTVKGKYCLWDTEDFQNIQEDMTVNALCYSTVTQMTTNMPSSVNVEVSSDEAELENIFKDMELEVTFESGETKKLYSGDYTLEAIDYNKDISGTYTVSVIYNNAKKDIQVNVNKIKNYVTVSLTSGNGYYNEGLPALIANTTVEGSVSFDPNQQLYVGSKLYNWTFIPVDSNKYERVTGKISVNLLTASSITTNKDSLVVKFATTKQEIINKIKDGLIVEGKYGEYFKNIDPSYYTIDSTDFVDSKSGVYTFRVSYDANTYVDIPVTVEKCDTYSLTVDEVSEFIFKEGQTLNDDVLPFLNKDSEIEGTIRFKEGQNLLVGNYEYEYEFVPTSAHYATKTGKVRVFVYKAESIEFTTDNQVVYGSDEDTIISQIRSGVVGKVYYNDQLSKDIDVNKISVTINDNYDHLSAGVYQYTLTYNDEITINSTFTLNKRVLKPGEDFNKDPVCLDLVDPNNYEIMPSCRIQKLDTTAIDFDETLFSIVPISAEPLIEGQIYRYHVELVPDESISDNYATIQFSFNAAAKRH